MCLCACVCGAMLDVRCVLKSVSVGTLGVVLSRLFRVCVFLSLSSQSVSPTSPIDINGILSVVA